MTSLVYYNRFSLLDSFLNNKIGNYSDKTLTVLNNHTNLCLNFHKSICIIDRETLQHPIFKISSIVPIIKKEYNSEYDTITFEELCFKRASELCSMNNIIQFFWSGGIDSTCALSVLKEVCPENLNVFYTESSIKENYKFYKNYLESKKIHSTFVTDDISSVGDDDMIMCDCTNADMLWGDVRIENVPIKYRNFIYSKDYYHYWYLRHRLIKQRFKLYKGYQKDTFNLSNYQPFYDTQDFEQLFLNKIISGELKAFNRKNSLGEKKAARNLIYKYTGDKDYAYNKECVTSIILGDSMTKNASVHGATQRIKFFLGIDSEGNVLKSPLQFKQYFTETFKQTILG